MFGSVGGAEFLLIAVLALLLFGPRKLPQIGRSVGKALAEFRGVTREFKSSLEQEVRLEEVRQVGDTPPVAPESQPPTIPRGESAPGQECDETPPVEAANGERSEKS
jgi:sec-independent protein translocase protein TatA